MAGTKLSAKNQETVDYLESIIKECDHWASLVEQFAAAKAHADQYATQLARELSQLRQKAMAMNLGYIADTAGQMSVQAGRSGSQMMKSRLLRDLVVSFKLLLERTIKATIQADESEKKEKEYQKAKEAKAAAERVKARVLAEEAKQAAKQGPAAPAAKPGAPPPPAPPPGPPPAPAKPEG